MGCGGSKAAASPVPSEGSPEHTDRNGTKSPCEDQQEDIEIGAETVSRDNNENRPESAIENRKELEIVDNKNDGEKLGSSGELDKKDRLHTDSTEPTDEVINQATAVDSKFADDKSDTGRLEEATDDPDHIEQSDDVRKDEEEDVGTLVLQEKEETSVKQEKEETPVKQEKEETPVKQEKEETPVKQEKEETPVKQERDKTPVIQENDEQTQHMNASHLDENSNENPKAQLTPPPDVVYTDHEEAINCTALTTDTTILITGSNDKTARLWPTRTKITKCIGILAGHDADITAITVDGTNVITGDAVGVIMKWDMATCESEQMMEGHRSPIRKLLSVGEVAIFSASDDCTARGWNFSTGEQLRLFKGHKESITDMILLTASEVRGDEDLLLTSSTDSNARCWSVNTGCSILTYSGHNSGVTCLATDKKKRFLYTGSADHTIMSWNILSGDMVKVFEGHSGLVTCIWVVGDVLYTGSADHVLRSWQAYTGDATGSYTGSSSTITCFRPLVRHEMLFVGYDDGCVRVFKVKAGTLLDTFHVNNTAVSSLEVVAGSLYLACSDGRLVIWDVKYLMQGQH